jgi:hypothetical protein
VSDTSREHIALACGIARDEGLMVAYLPELASVMQEYPLTWGTLYAQDGVAIDVFEYGKRVKWWKVREAARLNGLAIVEPVWQGPAEDFRLGMFPPTPKGVPQEGGQFYKSRLHMRAWRHGPWIDISKESNEQDFR